MNEATATFGAGCFWGVEQAFRAIPGVLDVVVGYAGGTVENPTYEQVCSGTTGHAEVAQVTYDSDQVTYEQLLTAFWQMHDPTQLNRQGPDVGTQYRSVIFYHTPEQRQAAEISKSQVEESAAYHEPVVTALEPAGPFYPAEEYHQRYFKKNGGGVCHI